MLETEPQNRQPEPNEPQDAGQGPAASQEGGHRRGLLRRGRRGVTKPAEPPEFKSGAPADEAPGKRQTARGTRPSPAAGGVPVVPGVPGPEPAAESAAGRRATAAGGSPQPVPAAAFQPPVLVFQPPELSGPASADSAGPGPGRDEDEAAEAAASRRRRRGGRGKGATGDAGSGYPASDPARDEPDAAQGGAEQPGGNGAAVRRGTARDRAEPGRQESGATAADGA